MGTVASAVELPAAKILITSPTVALVPDKDTSTFKPESRRLTVATSPVATIRPGALGWVVSIALSVNWLCDVLPAASVLVALTTTVSVPTNCPALAV